MRSLNPLTSSLSNRLIAAFLLAVLIPLALFSLLSLSGAREINFRNIEAYLVESAHRRQQGISTGFERAISALETLLNDETALQDLRWSLLSEDRPAPDDLLREDLVNRHPDLFRSAWMLTLDGQAFAIGLNAPFVDTDQSGSESFQATRNLQNRQGRNQEVVVSNRDGELHIEIVTLIRSVDTTPLGYIVTDLNLDEIVFAYLEPDNILESYSFLVMPDGQAYMAIDTVQSSDVITLNSEGVQSGLNRSASTVRTYQLANNQQVLGYYTAIDVPGKRFVLMNEIPTDAISGQILGYLRRTGFPLVVGSLVLSLVLAWLLSQVIVPPLNRVRTAMTRVIQGDFEVPVEDINRRDEIGALARTFDEMRQQFNRLITDLQLRVQQRDRDIRITQDISQAISGERDLQHLLDRVVDLIVENFPQIYHAQIFLTQDHYAILRASTGDPGQVLLTRGHRLRVGSVSVIGQVVEQSQTIIARDTSTSDVHHRNEFLPETRAELAVPLRLSDRVIGALDVQSKEYDSFDQDLINVLETLAGQITIAIENVRLYEEAQENILQAETAYRQRIKQDWQEYLGARRVSSLSSTAGNDTDYDFSALQQQAAEQDRVIIGDITAHGTRPVALPVRLRGQFLGVITFEVPDSDFQQDTISLAEELINRLALSLENARLFQESQQAIGRERTVNTITARISGQTDIEEILQTAVREVGQALRTPQVSVKLNLNTTNGQHDNGNSHETATSASQPDDNTKPEHQT